MIKKKHKNFFNWRTVHTEPFEKLKKGWRSFPSVQINKYNQNQGLKSEVGNNVLGTILERKSEKSAFGF